MVEEQDRLSRLFLLVFGSCQLNTELRQAAESMPQGERANIIRHAAPLRRRGRSPGQHNRCRATPKNHCERPEKTNKKTNENYYQPVALPRNHRETSQFHKNLNLSMGDMNLLCRE